MQKIINWTAKRAGGRITINGVDQATGRPTKIVGIEEIQSANMDDFPTAIRFDGTQYKLI